MNPTVPTARDKKRESLLKACQDAQNRYDRWPNKETSEGLDRARRAFNNFQTEHIQSEKDDKILKILAGTLAASMLIYILMGALQS